MYSLRSRLILSHILPLLIITPLVGLILISLLEKEVFLPTLMDEMTQQAELIATLSLNSPQVWQNPSETKVFIKQLPHNLLFVDAKGQLLASTLNQQVGPLDSLSGLEQALAGQSSQSLTYNQATKRHKMWVWVTVRNPSNQIIGVLRLERQFKRITDHLLLFWITSLLMGALLVGGIVGLLLALKLTHSLHSLTDAIYRLSCGEPLAPLPENGAKEIRQLLRAFNSLTARLQSLETSRRRLLANLVHELGRPLGAMQAAVEALRSGADYDQAFRDELLAGIAGEIQRLSRLLNNLARLDDRLAGNFELKLQPLPISQWLSEVISPWHSRAKQNLLTWQASIPANLPSVNADADYLGQVIGNLLSNAIKYTPTGGTVSVSAGHYADRIWVRVSDTGPGIPAEEQTQIGQARGIAPIFKSFYRRRAHTRFPQGMGLGLSIAQEITHAHGGQLELESSPQGSHFTLFLPVCN